MRSKVTSAIFKVLTVAALGLFLLTMEAITRGVLPLVAGGALSLLAAAGAAFLFLLSVPAPQPAKSRRPAAEKPVVPASQPKKGAVLIYMPDHPPTAC